MATRGVCGAGGRRDPLVAFYADLGRLAADEGEFKAASAAYQKAVVFARLVARRRESPWVVFADHVRFHSAGAQDPR